MKLELTEKEVKEILLQWAEKNWPQSFNAVDFAGTYNHSAKFTHEEPEKVSA